MQLIVKIICAKCGTRRTVHVNGGWDIRKLEHTCPNNEYPGGTWHFVYVPPRSVY